MNEDEQPARQVRSQALLSPSSSGRCASPEPPCSAAFLQWENPFYVPQKEPPLYGAALPWWHPLMHVHQPVATATNNDDCGNSPQKNDRHCYLRWLVSRACAQSLCAR